MNFPLDGPPNSPAWANDFWFRGRHGFGVAEYADLRTESTKLDGSTWVVVAEFDGPWHAWRMLKTHSCDGVSNCVIPNTATRAPLGVPDITGWESSIDRPGYVKRLGRIYGLMDEGALHQVNLCRILSTPVPTVPPAGEVARRLQAVHPAPYWGWFDLERPGGQGTWIVSASPEQAFSVSDCAIQLAPIKGTAPTADGLLPKDFAENALVAEALTAEVQKVVSDAHIAAAGEIEEHPHMVQLLSRIEGALAGNPTPGDWAALLAELLPPLSVTGVPRGAAERTISDLEPTRRGPYCGVVGWLDADSGTAELGVLIRSFWWDSGQLKCGTGAGIMRESDPLGEWQETEFKAQTVISALKSAVGQ